MISFYRDKFNREFTEEKYRDFLKDVHPRHDLVRDFRIAETPVFLPKTFQYQLLALFEEVKAFIARPDFHKLMEKAVPDRYHVPGEDSIPHFLAIDSAICKNEKGDYVPQLIELQGIASLFCYQRYLSLAYQRHFDIPEELSPFFGGIDHASYVNTLRKVILGDEEAENVILLDIKPKYQKTRIDFLYSIHDLGIKPVCISEVIQEGENLFYRWKGRKIPIRRIYNRLIFDELERRKDLDVKVDFTKPMNVKWIAHPNWFFKISKYTMPFLNSPHVPPSYFLHELKEYPTDLDNYVLKPLFSFAGQGVHFDVSRELLDSIPDPEAYILQKKVYYEPFLPTPEGNAKAEIRMLCIWDDTLKPLMTLARLSKGKIVGVDYNKDKTWVGSSAVFFTPE